MKTLVKEQESNVVEYSKVHFKADFMALNEHCIKWISCFSDPQILKSYCYWVKLTSKGQELYSTSSKCWFFGQYSLFCAWTQVNKPIQILNENKCFQVLPYTHIHSLSHFSPFLWYLKGALDHDLNYRSPFQLETSSSFEQSENHTYGGKNSSLRPALQWPITNSNSSVCLSFYLLGLIIWICGQEALLPHRGRCSAATSYVIQPQWDTCVGRKPSEVTYLLGPGEVTSKEKLFSHPFLSKAATSSTLMPKMNRFSSPASSAISTLAPSMVPMVRAPFSMNFILPVPEASVPAVEICSDRSVAGMTARKAS